MCGKTIFPLDDAFHITGLVFRRDQSMEAARFSPRQVQIAAALPNRCFDRPAVRLGRLERTFLTHRIGKEEAQFGALVAAAGEGAGARKINGRRQRFVDARAIPA